MAPDGPIEAMDTSVEAGSALERLRYATSVIRKLERISAENLGNETSVIAVGDVSPEIADYIEDFGLGCRRYKTLSRLVSDVTIARNACLIFDIDSASTNMSYERLNYIFTKLKIERSIFILNTRSIVADYLLVCPESRVLVRPFPFDVLLDQVVIMLTASLEDLSRRVCSNLLESKFNRLSPRERLVLDLVASGLTSKEIAKSLSISHRTVEVHRAHIFEKLSISSTQDLVRMTTLLGLLNHDCLIHRMVDEARIPWARE